MSSAYNCSEISNLSHASFVFITNSVYFVLSAATVFGNALLVSLLVRAQLVAVCYKTTTNYNKCLLTGISQTVTADALVQYTHRHSLQLRTSTVRVVSVAATRFLWLDWLLLLLLLLHESHCDISHLLCTLHKIECKFEILTSRIVTMGAPELALYNTALEARSNLTFHTLFRTKTHVV